MDLKHLRMFVDAADAGGLSRAAVRHGLVHATVSKQIAALETDVGGRLFHRTGRGLTLTELGQALLPRARHLLGEADSLLTATRDMAAEPTGVVTLAIQSSLARLIGSALLRKALQLHPGIRVRVMEGYNAHIQQWVASGQADLGIVNSYGGARRRGDAIADVRLWLIGSRQAAVARQSSVRLSTLARLPLVLPGHPNGLRVMLEDAARRHRLQLHVAMEVDSIAIQRDLVAEGDLFTVLPFYAVVDEVRAGRVSASPIVAPVLTRSLVIAATQAHPASAAARAIYRLVRDFAADMSRRNAWEGKA
ncbi:LysR family transcriptional regulator [Xenophilus azovorans]|uniref:LysR family transcriptional regulator n=1 Tax=Xenophilus azovorans TaxID=151755 RepID=UPI00068A8090|nr:LysR family transcriptional regulator [Xenophilus azovorans]